MDLYPNQVKLFTFKQLLSKVYIKWWQDIRTGREASEIKELIIMDPTFKTE